MDPNQNNVLWEIRCGQETAEGFHSGADVSLLSQYPSEQEMLFPPLTMLKVIKVEEQQPVCVGGEQAGGHDETPCLARMHTAEMADADPVKESTPHGARFIRLVVTPTFV